ncbi:MAG: EpsD family peptidyl-prolyl cis-trans isomerase [Proteobacteria bacterium]|jgi:EpsD family peptidyl-prolyl cis-trans isomerase|nr:EpsD family peptidyl-prolyl cis-trans isomerase [Pseudomonadota bacterium]
MQIDTITTLRIGRTAAIRAVAVAAVVGTALLGAGCGDKKDRAGSRTAATVDKHEITVEQVELVLQQQRGLRTEQLDAARRQILERLIDQELAVDNASKLGLERDPRVMRQIEAARRDALARAYAERVGDAAPRPTPEEIHAYYEGKPALFAQRRLYTLQEFAIEAAPEQVPMLRDRLSASTNIAEFVEYLRANGVRFAANQVVRAAEQLPLPSLDAIARLADGQAIMTQVPSGLQLLVQAGSSPQPVSEEQARTAIEAFLLNERRRKLVENDLAVLRAAAKIEYMGKFAEAPPAGTSAPAAEAVAPIVPMTPAFAASAALDGSHTGAGATE